MSACDVHYKFSVRLMRILGLWPYDSESTRRIRATLVNIFCSLMIIVQITPFITGDFDFMLLLQALPITIISLGSVVKFNAFLFMTSAIKQLMESIQAKWNTTHKDTLEILERRATLGKQQGAIYAIFIYPSALLVTLYRVSSYIMIVATPANSTEIIPFPIVTDYLVDEDKYLFYIVIHQCISFFLITTIYVATETLFIMWLQHSISLYEIVCYNIEKGIAAAPSYITEKLMNTYRSDYIAKAVNYHADAKVYSTPWYNTSVFTQKQLLLIITRCNEALIFDLYGFFNASIEGFSGLVRCTMSYFMMLTSMQ
ncbi:uncharacterized protein LOC117218888 isoform X3 [Megalopta genalis]|uniref:uncharacterized protein LOC117218888 isoform X3 n=1 Tax=Megalopta genalis TaxID=115081 RepID=UPI003FD6A27B